MTRPLSRFRALVLPAILVGLGATRAAAQDTTQAIDKVRVGVEYQPGVRPGLVVLPGAGLDSARAIVHRDLDYSDRFEMVPLDTSPASRGGAEAGGTSYGIYKALGAEFGVEMSEVTGGVAVRLHDLSAGKVRVQETFQLPAMTDPTFRYQVHNIADQVARWATGTEGVATTRLLFVSGGRVYRIDSDGEVITPLTPAGQTSLSPVWSPDGQRFAYTVLAGGRGGVMVQTLASGAALQVPGTNTGLNITPAFSPDGRLLAYAHSDETGTDIFLANIADRCCAQRLTGTLRGQLISNVFSRWPPHRVRIHAGGTAPSLRHGRRRDRSGTARAVRFRRDGQLQRPGVVARRGQRRVPS